MKTPPNEARPAAAGFTIVEVMISMTIVVLVLGMAMSTYLFCLRTMYKDTQRLATNAALRSFMAQISKETLNASYFYLFPYYTALDGSVRLVDQTTPSFIAADTSTLDFVNAADDDYDKWVAHGDCLVLITKTSEYRTTDIRQIRIYYRITTNQTTANEESPIRYYETTDWGEGPAPNNPDPTNANPTLTNGHPVSGINTELNNINLNSNPSLSGSRQLALRTKGRAVDAPYTGYTAGDRYPMFSSESPTNSNTNGFISLNVEFINGSTINNLLSSSSFNYTISPRR